MNLNKYALLSSLALLSCSFNPLLADLTPGESNSSDEAMDDERFKVIRQYIDAKRSIDIKQKGGNLKIGGDVRVDYKSVNQLLDGVKVNGRGQGGDRNLYGKETNIPSSYGDVSASLSFEYKNERSFANILVKMSNHAGLDTTNYSDVSSDLYSGSQSRLEAKNSYSPSKNKLDLARAYIGYELWSQDSHTVEGNLGRQRLYDLFDSRVMFANRFDGVALKYKGAFDGVGHAHATYGVFMVSDRVEHVAHALELGLANIADTGFGLKYALINWARSGVYSDGSMGSMGEQATKNNNRATNTIYQYLNEAFRYEVSQLLATYHVPEEWAYGQKVKLYAAYLQNHKARPMTPFYTNLDKDRTNRRAWYAGFTLGRIAMPGDTVLDICYQYVQPQSVPDFDSFAGAGRGNLTNVWGVMDHSQGNNNYKGVRAQLAYCFSADIMFNVVAIHTNAVDGHLSSNNNLARQTAGGNTLKRGARNSWDSLEAEVVYSF